MDQTHLIEVHEPLDSTKQRADTLLERCTFRLGGEFLGRSADRYGERHIVVFDAVEASGGGAEVAPAGGAIGIAGDERGRDVLEEGDDPRWGRRHAGSFFPSLLERRRRIDRALFAVVMEAYVHGVSTRKVDDLVGALGVASGISKSEVSRICADLDGDLEAFRNRPLDHVEFPYVFATPPTSRAGSEAGWSRGRWWLPPG